MSSTTVYLDANASEILRPEARAAAIAALDLDGNPSSVHRAGRRARALLEESRERIAAAFGADPAGLVFTSGGTEADTLAIAALGAGRRILIGATEHDAVRAAAPDAVRLPVRPDGTLEPRILQDALDSSDRPALVCLMLANNETGVLHPIAELAALCRDRNALLHVDAVQAAGRIPVSLPELGADSLALSAHKLGGPKGAGALLLRSGERGFHLAASIAGGGQERGRRGGTPSLPAIAGFSAATEAACATLPRFAALATLRDRIEAACRRHGALVAGADAPRLPNTSSLVLPGRRADAQLIALDLAGIAVSAGAACSSGKVAASHVLDAMGFGNGAEQAIRVSLPWNATDDHADRFIAAYARMAATPSRLSA